MSAILLLNSVKTRLLWYIGGGGCTADVLVIRRVPISGSQVACTLKVALD